MTIKCRCGREIPEEEVLEGYKWCGICQEEHCLTEKEAKERGV